MVDQIVPGSISIFSMDKSITKTMVCIYPIITLALQM